MSITELEKRIQDLEQALADSRAALNDCMNREKQRQQLQKALATATLAGGITHDFNNLLGIILGNTELALNDLPHWDPARDWLAEIKTASLRAQGIIRQMEALSKIANTRRAVHLKKIVQDMLSRMVEQLPSGVAIQERLDLDQDIVMADLLQLHKALTVLATIVCDRLSSSGGTLRVSLEPVVMAGGATVAETDVGPGKYGRLKIICSPPGNTAEGNDTFSCPGAKGPGQARENDLSDAAVRDIVALHGGTVTISEAADESATIQILLPLVDVCTTIAPLNELEGIKKIVRILFVDDEIALVRLGKQMLSHYGYVVETYVNPLNALEQFRKHPDQYDLVITDLTMPQMSGCELIKEMIKVRPDIPVIACSGHSDLIDSGITDQPAVKAFLAKPIRMIELNNKVREVVAEKG